MFQKLTRVKFVQQAFLSYLQYLLNYLLSTLKFIFLAKIKGLEVFCKFPKLICLFFALAFISIFYCRFTLGTGKSGGILVNTTLNKAKILQVAKIFYILHMQAKFLASLAIYWLSTKIVLISINLLIIKYYIGPR